jgi:hypothetical protein
MKGRGSHLRGPVHQGHWRASDAALELPEGPFRVARHGNRHPQPDGTIYYPARTQSKIVKPVNKRETERYHARRMKKETAEFRAVAKQEGVSPVELRTLIDQAKATKGELTARETRDRAAAAPAPVEAAKPPSAAPEWPSEKWKGSPEELSRKQLAIFAFLRRVWVPFIEDTGALVTRQMIMERDDSAGLALKSALRSRALPDDIRIVPTRELKKTLLTTGQVVYESLHA